MAASHADDSIDAILSQVPPPPPQLSSSSQQHHGALITYKPPLHATPPLHHSTPLASTLDSLNHVQIQWQLRSRPPPARPGRRAARALSGLSLLPLLRRVPVFEPLSYHVATTSYLPLTDSSSLSLSPQLVVSATTVDSALTAALHTRVSSALSCSSSVRLSSAAPAVSSSVSLSSPASLTTASITATDEAIRLSGRWERRVRSLDGVVAVELVQRAEGLPAVSVGWSSQPASDRKDNGGRHSWYLVRVLGRVVECSTRMSFPLARCPPFNTAYLHAAVILTAPPSAAPVRTTAAAPGPLLASIDTAGVCVELGVTANINRRHSVDMGLGWSTLGVYVHLRFCSQLTAFSFPVYLSSAPGVAWSSSSPLSALSLSLALPAGCYFAYALLISPLYRLYRRRYYASSAAAGLQAASSSSSALITVHRATLRPIAASRHEQELQKAASAPSPALAPPHLLVLEAYHGYAVESSVTRIWPSDPFFPYLEQQPWQPVRWVAQDDVVDVVRFWVRDGRCVLTERRKTAMVGMGRLPRPRQSNGEQLVLGLYVRYRSAGVERELWIGETERCDMPSETHRKVPPTVP